MGRHTVHGQVEELGPFGVEIVRMQTHATPKVEALVREHPDLLDENMDPLLAFTSNRGEGMPDRHLHDPPLQKALHEEIVLPRPVDDTRLHPALTNPSEHRLKDSAA